jgi:hypothetical protein
MPISLPRRIPLRRIWLRGSALEAYPGSRTHLRGSGLDRPAVRGEESVAHHRARTLKQERHEAMAGSIDWFYTRKG